MTHNQNTNRLFILGKWLLGIAGAGCIILALVLDFIGVGGDPRFGVKQSFLAIGGTYALILLFARSGKLRALRSGLNWLLLRRGSTTNTEPMQCVRQAVGLLLITSAFTGFWLSLVEYQSVQFIWVLLVLASVTLFVPDFGNELETAGNYIHRFVLLRYTLTSNTIFPLLAIGLVILLNWFPLRQMYKTGGYLCYANAYDEITYLQYDFSRACPGFLRASQSFVTLGHNIGISGAWLNFLFDVSTQIIFIFLIRAILLQLNYRKVQADIGSLMLTILPIAFCGGYNQLFLKLCNFLIETGWLYWVATPSNAWFLPLERTPEPQFSLILVAFSVYLSLRFKSFWAAYPCLPFLYPAIAVPYAMCLLSFHLYSRARPFVGRPTIALLAAFVFVSFGLGIYISYFTPTAQRAFITLSYAPQLSVTGVSALICYTCLVWFIPKNLRVIGLIIALAPTLVANQQVVSGWFAAPHNYEQYFGVMSAATIFILALRNLLQYRPVLLMVIGMLCLLAYDHGRHVYRMQQQITKRVVLSDDLLAVLRNNSSNVVMDDADAASLVSLVFPRQPPTIFGVSNAYVVLANEKFPHYLWAKTQIQQRKDIFRRFENVFAYLDERYKYESADFIFLHCGRRSQFVLKHDTTKAPFNNGYEPLQIILLGKNGETPTIFPAKSFSSAVPVLDLMKQR